MLSFRVLSCVLWTLHRWIEVHGSNLKRGSSLHVGNRPECRSLARACARSLFCVHDCLAWRDGYDSDVERMPQNLHPVWPEMFKLEPSPAPLCLSLWLGLLLCLCLALGLQLEGHVGVVSV